MLDWHLDACAAHIYARCTTHFMEPCFAHDIGSLHAVQAFPTSFCMIQANGCPWTCAWCTATCAVHIPVNVAWLTAIPAWSTCGLCVIFGRFRFL